jgi:hypothetical protein
MQARRIWPLALMLVSGLAFGAVGGGDTTADKPGAETSSTDPARVRELGNDICVGAVDVTAQLGEAFRQLSMEVLPKLVQTTQQLAVDLQPTMEQLGDRMQEVKQQLQQAKRNLERGLFDPPPKQDR